MLAKALRIARRNFGALDLKSFFDATGVIPDPSCPGRSKKPTVDVLAFCFDSGSAFNKPTVFEFGGIHQSNPHRFFVGKALLSKSRETPAEPLLREFVCLISHFFCVYLLIVSPKCIHRIKHDVYV